MFHYVHIPDKPWINRGQTVEPLFLSMERIFIAVEQQFFAVKIGDPKKPLN